MKKWNREKRKIAYIAFFALAGLAVWLGWSSGDDSEVYEERAKEESQADVEITVPNVFLTKANGTAAELRDLYNDKPVLLVFWMPWSDDSKRQLDEAAAVYEQYGKDMHFVIVSMGSTAAEAKAYYEEKGYAMPWYSGDISLSGDINVYDVPQLLVIRRGGALSARRKGLVPARDLAYLLARCLAEP